jgi:NAD(P)-dependent dehydrogenase (short-subunit alcohol dehydrogenase family)
MQVGSFLCAMVDANTESWNTDCACIPPTLNNMFDRVVDINLAGLVHVCRRLASTLLQPCLIEITADARNCEAQPMKRQSRDSCLAVVHPDCDVLQRAPCV